MKKNYGLIAAVAIILFSVYVYVNTLTITSTANAALGPAFMPKMVAVILFILGWLDLFEELKKKKDAAAKAEREAAKTAGTEGDDAGAGGIAAGANAGAGGIAAGANAGAGGTAAGANAGTLAGLRALMAARVDVFSSILMLCYVFSIKRLGFLIASAIYMLLQMLLLTVNSKRNYILIIFMTIVVPSIVYFGFVKIFYLMLPPGIFG